MTTTEANRALHPAVDLFGAKVAARLSSGADALPYEVTERLRASRVRALAARKRVAQPVRAHHVVVTGGAAALGGAPEKLSFWQQLASVLPIVVLAVGLVLIHTQQNDIRASELAEVDVALLTDDLPPAAYADPGFVQFLKTHRE
jgi:hypothetical protein